MYVSLVLIELHFFPWKLILCPCSCVVLTCSPRSAWKTAKDWRGLKLSRLNCFHSFLGTFAFAAANRISLRGFGMNGSHFDQFDERFLLWNCVCQSDNARGWFCVHTSTRDIFKEDDGTDWHWAVVRFVAVFCERPFETAVGKFFQHHVVKSYQQGIVQIDPQCQLLALDKFRFRS